MYHYITQQGAVESLLPILMKDPSRAWGFDTETTGLDPHVDRVTLMQIGDTDTQYIIDTRMVNPEPLRPFIESQQHRKVGHFLKFDYKMIKGSFGMDLEGMRDTWIAEKVMNAGRKFGKFGLDDTLASWLDIHIDKTLQKSFIKHQGPFTDDQLVYAATDVQHLLPLLCAQSNELAMNDLHHTFLLECEAQAAFADMEFAGMLLDRTKWQALMESNLIKAKEVEKQLNFYASQFMRANLFGDIMNYNSPKQVVELLHKMRIKIVDRDPKTGKDVEMLIPDSSDASLKKVAGDYPFIKLLKTWRSLMVRVNTFGQPYLDAIHPKTGRFHPNYDQLGTETGRPTAGESEANPLNIPRENEFRNCFVAPEDYVIETDDYSGCELRILAEISQDPKLAEAFHNRVDVHCYVASTLYGVDVTKKNENKHLRTPAKSLNFGRH